MRKIFGLGDRSIKTLAAAGGASLIVAGSAIAWTLSSSASPSIAPAVVPSSHTVPKLKSIPPHCPAGQLYQPGQPLCIDGVHIKAAPSGMPKNKALIFYGEEELATYGISKQIREPYVAPNAPGMIKEPDGNYARVGTNPPKASEIQVAPPDNRIPPIIETSMWDGWSGKVAVSVQAGTDIATGDAAVLVSTQVETQVVTPNSGVYKPGPFNGEVFVSPRIKGDLKVISASGDIVALQLRGTTTKYHFNAKTDAFVN